MRDQTWLFYIVQIHITDAYRGDSNALYSRYKYKKREFN